MFAHLSRRYPEDDLLKMRKALVAALAATALALGPVVPATAQQAAPAQGSGLAEGVAAIVNDEVISTFDVRQRARFILATSGLGNSAEAQERARQQALDDLINERLQLQEARQWKVRVGDADVDRAVANLARQNGGSAQQLEGELARIGVNPGTFREQLRAELAWQRLVGGRYGSRVRVSPERVTDTLNRIAQSAQRTQYLVSEIVLDVESPDQNDVVYQGAQRLLAEMQRGAPFAAVAQQFSSAPSSVAGGDLGWMGAGEMRPEMEAVVASLQPGQVSTPIPAPGGYLIVLLRDRREGKPPADRLRLREVVLSADEATRARASETLERARRQIAGCDGLDATMQKAAPGARIIDLGEVRDIDLSDLYRNALAGVAAGRASAPFATQDGANMLVVCSRVAETGDATPTRAQIEDRLYEQELGMLARRYLRDLRRDSAIITR